LDRKTSNGASEKGDNPLLNLPPKRGEKQREDFALSTCQLFNLSTKRESGKWTEKRQDAIPAEAGIQKTEVRSQMSEEKK